MKKKLAYLIQIHLIHHRSIYVFTVILFFIGVIFGAVVVNSLSLTQKHDLHMYVMQFFGQVSEGQFASAKDMFFHSFRYYAVILIVMWLLGLSVIGFPIIFILLFI